MQKVYYLYTYDLTKKSASDKVRIVYVLKGRPGENGVLDGCKAEILAPGCFMVLEKNAKEIDAVFKYWKVKHKRKRIMLMN